MTKTRTTAEREIFEAGRKQAKVDSMSRYDFAQWQGNAVCRKCGHGLKWNSTTAARKHFNKHQAEA